MAEHGRIQNGEIFRKESSINKGIPGNEVADGWAKQAATTMASSG